MKLTQHKLKVLGILFFICFGCGGTGEDLPVSVQEPDGKQHKTDDPHSAYLNIYPGPQVVETIPRDYEDDLQISRIYARFDQNMDADCLTESTFKVQDGWNGFITGAVAYDRHHQTVSFTADGFGFQPGHQYRAILTTGVCDSGGFHLQNTYFWTFGISKSPKVYFTIPQPRQENADRNSTIHLWFNKPMDEATINHNTLAVVEDGVGRIHGKILYNSTGREAIFAPLLQLNRGSRYIVRILHDVRDEEGHQMKEDLTWHFTVSAEQ